MSQPHPQSLVCQRCATVALPGADVCTSCCSALHETAPAPMAVAQPASEPIDVPAQREPMPQSVFGAWPFGVADAEAVAQVAAQEAQTDLRDELEAFDYAASATHVLSGVPGQRSEHEAEMPSVPSFGPNPFLAAARMGHVEGDPTSHEAYSG